MYNFNIIFKFVNTFLSQTYILALFNGKRSKVIFFYLFLNSTTQGSRRRDLIKNVLKVNNPIKKFFIPYTPRRFEVHFKLYRICLTVHSLYCPVQWIYKTLVYCTWAKVALMYQLLLVRFV